jgi:hypothetical protein
MERTGFVFKMRSCLSNTRTNHATYYTPVKICLAAYIPSTPADLKMTIPHVLQMI